jgi:hypothetical protein
VIRSEDQLTEELGLIRYSIRCAGLLNRPIKKWPLKINKKIKVKVEVATKI